MPQMISVHIPIDYKAVKLTKDFTIAVSCTECGFFDKKGAGSKSN